MSHRSLGLNGFNVLFIYPLIYRPLKVNFAKRFNLLSGRCSGHIFALCSDRHSELALGRFCLYSERPCQGLIGSLLTKARIHVLMPLWRARGRPRVDAIIAYDPLTSGVAGMVLKFLLRTKLIVEFNMDYQGTYHKDHPPGQRLEKRLRNVLIEASLRSADAIKVINRDQEAFCLQHYGAKPVHRFPDFVASSYFQSLTSYQGNYLLSIGEPFHRKGMDVLIRAFTTICHNHPTVTLRIMGYCPNDELEQYRQLAPQGSRIEFVKPGWIEDVGEHMRGCYALVSAARSEAQGRVLFEAMACKKPVVATRTNGGTDYVQDGRTGLLCDIESPDDMAKKLDYLLSNPGLAMQMGEAGFEWLQEGFSEEKYTSKFLAMLERVVSSTR